jgi:hypothetical protein
MKKILLSFVVLSFLGAPSYAQNGHGCEQAGNFWICPKPKPPPICYEFGGDDMICNEPVDDKPPKNCKFNGKNKFVCRDP